MGLFDRFKKKPSAPPDPAPAPQPEHALPDAYEMLGIVLEKTKNGKRTGDTITFPTCHLQLGLEYGEMSVVKGRYCVQLLFLMIHPFFDEPLLESVAGVGNTPEEAVRQGTEQFCAGVLTFVLAALQCKGEKTLTSTLEGKPHIFHLPCVMAVQHFGVQGDGHCDLWELVADRIPDYLGTKRAYWIKLFIAYTEQPICEARINGIVYPELTAVLQQAAARQTGISPHSSDKMFVLLIQDEATFTPCPYTKETVTALVETALDKMQGIHDAASCDRIFQEIASMAPDASLGTELCAFLPEIYSHTLYQYHQPDVVCPTEGWTQGELRRSQIRSYGYMEGAVQQYLRSRQPSKEDHLPILRMSASFKALNQAVSSGSKMEHLTFAPLYYPVSADYHVW